MSLILPEPLASASAEASALPGLSLCVARPGQIDLAALAPEWRAPAQALRDGLPARALRRALDVALSLAALLLAAPALLALTLLVKLDSDGPAFYRQERVGLGGRCFTLLKFRSMRVDAEPAGPRWASPQDPRVTRVGRLLRLTRLDELPQLFNVLGGSMALVGPRPERPHFAEQLAQVIPHFAERLAVKPGVTGWAQVKYPYGASVEDARQKLAYDLYYLKHRSVQLDLRILLATASVMLNRTGAR